MRLEFGKQRVFFDGREPVARRVGDDGHAARLRDPAYGLAQPGPVVGHIAGLAGGEETAEDFAVVAAHAGFNQKAGEMGAGDEGGAARVAQCAFVSA